jgi:hypothetical protein
MVFTLVAVSVGETIALLGQSLAGLVVSFEELEASSAKIMSSPKSRKLRVENSFTENRLSPSFI